jgi:hypothetical protein
LRRAWNWQQFELVRAVESAPIFLPLVSFAAQNTLPGVSGRPYIEKKAPSIHAISACLRACFCRKTFISGLIKKHSTCSEMSGSRHLCLPKCRIRTGWDVRFSKKTSCRFGIG